jgi:hypothetical protein
MPSRCGRWPIRPDARTPSTRIWARPGTWPTNWPLRNRWATLTVGDNGTLLSLREKGTGRELLAAPHPVLAVEQASGRRLQAGGCGCEDGLLIAEFPRGGGSAAIRIESREDYFTVTAAALDVPDVQRFTFFQIARRRTSISATSRTGIRRQRRACACAAWASRSIRRSTDRRRGSALDDRRARSARAPRRPGGRTAGVLDPRPAFDGGERECTQIARRRALGDGRRGDRGSYLFADLAAKDTDAWIELARRGGFTNIHLHGWWSTLGHYEPRAAYFPGGLED